MLRFQSEYSQLKNVLQFFKKGSRFQKICFKVKVLKTFKIPVILKRSAILKRFSAAFLEEPMLFLLALK